MAIFLLPLGVLGRRGRAIFPGCRGRPDTRCVRPSDLVLPLFVCLAAACRPSQIVINAVMTWGRRCWTRMGADDIERRTRIARRMTTQFLPAFRRVVVVEAKFIHVATG